MVTLSLHPVFYSNVLSILTVNNGFFRALRELVEMEEKNNFDRWPRDGQKYLHHLQLASTIKSNALLEAVYNEASQYATLQHLKKRYPGKILKLFSRHRVGELGHQLSVCPACPFINAAYPLP